MEREITADDLKVKLLGISGSARHGNTELALKEALKAAAAEPFVSETDLINLGDFNLQPCRGCFKCWGWRAPAEDEEFECYESHDDSAIIMKRLKSVDGIIIGTPIYHGQKSSLLAILMEKAHCFGFLSYTRNAGKLMHKSLGAIEVGITDWGGQAVSFCGDISKFDVAQKLIQTAIDNFGRIDILVNNAGVGIWGLPWDMTEDEWDRLLDIHLKGTFNCTRHACSLMKEQRWGRLINVTSPNWLGCTEHCNYAAAKAGIVGFTRAVARDIGRYGVTCNCYAPSAKTRFSPTGDPWIRERFQRAYEAGVVTEEQYERVNKPELAPSPEGVAQFVAYLSTDEASDINGKVFLVRGGHVAIYTEPVEENPIDKEEGFWAVEELIEQVPEVVLKGYQNPAPAWPPEKEIPEYLGPRHRVE